MGQQRLCRGNLRGEVDISRYTAMSVSTAALRCEIPALATKVSTPPRQSIACCVAAVIAASSRTSKGRISVSPSIPPATCVSRAASRPDRMIRAPRAAHSRASAAPMPLLAPVIQAVLPSKLIILPPQG
jgi:hypothetical protein